MRQTILNNGADVNATNHSDTPDCAAKVPLILSRNFSKGKVIHLSAVPEVRETSKHAHIQTE